MDDRISRRRLLGAFGAGAAGVAGGHLAGGLFAPPAGAATAGPDEVPREFRTRLTERYGMTYPIVRPAFRRST